MKPDAAAIEAYVKKLATQQGIAGTTRAPWPHHLFRIDDVKAAANVLERRALYSRDRASALGLLSHDSAHPEIIASAPDWLKRCVRLYFRPRTPTEYASEGFRPKREVAGRAHRPMPVILVFASVPILSAVGTTFTKGNATTHGVERGGDATFLKAIPFDKVYHEGPLPDAQKAEIVFRRCAEVLVENELDLTHLRRVLCRSQAEYETLLDLLTPATRQQFSKMISLSVRSHYKRWTYLESVDVKRDNVTLNFSPVSASPGPFEILVEIFDATGKPRGMWRNAAFMANRSQRINLTSPEALGAYRVRVSLDGLLAYSGVFKPEEALL